MASNGKFLIDSIKNYKNWLYMVNYDTEDYYNCEANGCDYMCRCRTIDYVKVTSVNLPDFLHTFFDREKGYENDFGYALANLLIKNIFKTGISDLFDYKVVSSYYGEEVDRIYLANNAEWGEIYKQLDVFNRSSNSERVTQVLVKEYGYILPELNKYSEWEMVSVPVSDISANKDTLKNVSSKIVDYYTSTYAPWGMLGQTRPGRWAHELRGWYPSVIVVPYGEKLKLIDGFHRFKSWTTKPKYISNQTWKKNRRKNKIIVIRPKE